MLLPQGRKMKAFAFPLSLWHGRVPNTACMSYCAHTQNVTQYRKTFLSFYSRRVLKSSQKVENYSNGVIQVLKPSKRSHEN